MLLLNFTQEKEIIEAGEAWIRCSLCGSEHETDVIRVLITDKWWGLVTVKRTRETMLKCVQCETTQVSSLTLGQLAGYSPEQLGHHFRPRVDLITIVLLVAGFITFCLPPASLFFFVLAHFQIQRGMPMRRLTRVLMAVSGLLTVLFFVMMLLQNL